MNEQNKQPTESPVPKKILIVDDEPDVVEVTKSILVKRGYEIAIAYNGLQGLEQVKKEKPDLILTDVLMPQMDGFSFYKELKRHRETAEIPILIVTARGKMEDSFTVLGVSGFISKPFTPQELCDEIENILQIADTREHLGVSSKKKTTRILAVGAVESVLEDIFLQARKFGCETVTVDKGIETISKAVQYAPHIVVIDIQIPDMEISEVTEVLRRLPKFEGNPIIGYSYYDTAKLDDPEVRKKMLAVHAVERQFMLAGGTEYIGRFDAQKFAHILMNYLKT